ncbi:MAG: nuclear transport factor 2 family protein [Solirubrobacterales bacterium]
MTPHPATPADVQRVESSYEALNRRDIDATVAVLDDDALWVEHSELPEAGSYQGVATIRSFLEHYLESWEELHQEIEDRDVRGHCVLLFIHLEARGKGSGIEVNSRYAHLWQLSEGRGTRVDAYYDREQALAALRAAYGE